MLRNLFVAALSATSLKAAACPSLTGNYKCSHEDGTVDTMWIAQEQRGDMISYSFNGSEMNADNSKREITGDPTFRNGFIRAWCEGDNFRSEMVGQYFEKETKTGEIDVVMNISIQEGRLIEAASGTMKNAVGEYPINGLVTCTREDHQSR